MIETLIHLSDIHIRFHERNEEYRGVFETFFHMLDERGHIVNNKSLCVITGDVVHDKRKLSAQSTELLFWFLEELARRVPTCVILGNHDLDLMNEQSTHMLTAAITYLQKLKLPIYLLEHSGRYIYNNISFHVISVHDSHILDVWENEGVEIPESFHTTTTLYDNECKESNMKHVGLFHGGWSKSHQSYFQSKDCSIVCLGDIHKHQVVSGVNPLALYPGSMVQQSFGEELLCHGYVTYQWNTEDLPEYEYHDIQQPYGYVRIGWNPHMKQFMRMSPQYRLPTNVNTWSDITRCGKKNIRVRMYLPMSSQFLPQESKESFLEQCTSRNIHVELCDIVRVSVTHVDETALEDGQAAMEQSHDVKTQDLSVKQLMELYNEVHGSCYSTDVIDELVGFHDHMIDALVESGDISSKDGNTLFSSMAGTEQRETTTWNLMRVKWSNMFCYDEKNEIVFDGKKGIVGILGNNHIGKSSIIEIILFCLFDKTTKGLKRSVIRHGAETFSCSLEFMIGTERYEIQKSGKRMKKKKDNISVTTKFYHWRENTKGVVVKVPLTAEDRSKCQQEIKQYVGTWEDFCVSAVTLQHDGKGFLQFGETELKHTLLRLFRLDRCGIFHKCAKDMNFQTKKEVKALKANASSQSVKDIDARIKEIEESITQSNQYKRDADQLKVTYGSVWDMDTFDPSQSNHATCIVDGCEYTSGDSIDTAIEQKSQSVLTYTTNRNELFSCWDDAVEAHQVWTHDQKRKLRGIRENLEILESNLHEEVLHSVSYYESLYSKCTNKMKSCKTRLSSLTSEMESCTALLDEEETIQEQYEEMVQHQGKLSALEGKYETTVYEHKRAVRKRDMIAKAVNDSTITFDESCSHCMKNPLVIEMKSQQSMLEDKNTIVNELVSKKEELEKQIAAQQVLLENKDRIQSTYQNLTKARRRYDSLMEEYNQVVDERKQYKTKSKDAKQMISFAKDNADIQKDIDSLLETQRTTRSMRDNKYEEYRTICEKITQIENTIQTLTNAKQTLSSKDAIESWHTYSKCLANVMNEDEIASLQRQLGQLDASKQEIMRQTSVIQQKEKTIFLSDIYTKMMDAHGLPMIVFDRYVPTLTNEMNTLLASFCDFHISFDNNIHEKTMKCFIHRDDIAWNASLGSGYEQFVISLAFRIALSNLHISHKPNFLMIDEGWTSFDDKNREKIPHILSRLCDHVDFCILITHMEELKQYIQHGITITRTGQTSHVKS